MTSSLLIVVLTLSGATAVGTAYWRWKVANQRREALFAFATIRGWDFTVRDDALAALWFRAPFGQGERRRVTHVIRGTVHGRPLLAFDYSYDLVTRDSKGLEVRRTARLSVVAVELPTYLPWLELRPETVLDRASDASGASRDFELESDAFNRRYRIATRDPKFATDVLSARTMDLMLSRESLTFRFDGTHAISWRPGSTAPLDLVQRASTLNAVIDGVPPFVWRDHGAVG